ncbi:MAG: 5'/3'-nucleotidase SurE [Erysipelotrichaceae bacterium]|nr:5'/3'-nucleotidase SurE [Erysipelotrichaceae bacterium]
MNILVTNDDGIKAAGLKAIVKELASLGDVYVVAPNSQCSAYSHKMTLSGLLRFEEKEMPGAKKSFALWGTPVDCVHLGCDFLVGKKIDLVVSGINKGPNLSTDIIYSGTIAAAREAFIHKIPSVALSLNSFTVKDFSTAARLGTDIVRRYYEREDKGNYVLNVNIPCVPEEEIKGIRVCDKTLDVIYQDKMSLYEKNGKTYVRLSTSPERLMDASDDLSIDYIAIQNSYISISALQNEHINKTFTARLKEGF